MKTSYIAAATVAGLASLAGAQERVFGVTDNQQLVSFWSDDPGIIRSGVALQGLEQNENILGIDFRPADGMLYGLGSLSNLYQINTKTGQATLVGNGFTPELSGSSFGFDFNPTIDRIRVVSDADQNTVLNPNDGTGTGVNDLFYADGDVNNGQDPNVVGIAYTNSFDGAEETQQYGIDTGLGVLVTVANNEGTLETVGVLQAEFTDTLGFDISGASGVAFAAVMDEDIAQSSFWMVNLEDGSAQRIGEIGGGAVVGSIAVVPAPASTALLALAGLAANRRRR